MNPKRAVVLLLLLAAVAAFFALGGGDGLSLEALRARQAELAARVAAQPLAAAALFFAVYVAVAALSLPGAVPLTLLGGALFGLGWGTLLVSFASSVGALGAFLVARYVLREAVQRRFGARLAELDRGIAREGGFYLFALRLVPVVPFVVINLALGLTAMRAGLFYVVSQIGMLPGTLVYVYAGTQLATLGSAGGLLSPGLLAAFVALGVFPLLARRGLAAWRRARVQAPWAAAKPRRFDRNLVVIGAGSAGLVASYIAAALQAKVTLVERHRMGGDCLNTGCVPSKALITAARTAQTMREAARHGLHAVEPQVDFAAVMRGVRAAVAAIEPHDSVARYTGLGVEVLQGDATIVDPWHVRVALAAGGEQVLATRAIVIATGAAPVIPPLPGLAECAPLTSDTLWSLDALPRRLLVLGGGPIGCELAQAFARLGAQVRLVEAAPRLLAREDEAVSTLIAQALAADGVALHLGAAVTRFEAGQRAVLADGSTLAFDRVLVAVGRAARLQGFGLEALGIPAERTVATDEYLETLHPNIYACGDVAGPWQFTHAAGQQGWVAAVNALFGSFYRFKDDRRLMPRVTYVAPEVAAVGLNEQAAREQGVAYELTRFDLDDLDRALVEARPQGFFQVLTEPGRDRLLGVTIVGEHAGELLAEWVLAMKHGLGLKQLLGTIHAYPSWSESARRVAGEWQRARTPVAALRWLRRWHDWRRG